VTRRQFELAREAWAAWNAPHPRDLIRLAGTRSRALPFLPEAIKRYLAEYPSTGNGLSRTAQLTLEEIEGGARSAGEAFARVQDREPRPFMGDSMFYAVARDLATGLQPLLAGTHPRLARLSDGELRDRQIWLTPQGKRVLAGQADWCELSGIARQIGGVTLQGAHPRWRWNPDEERLVERRRK
jgi:DNA-binding transcriptional LysR family regulator